MKKSPEFCYLMKWDMFFQGATFIFSPNVPGATLIPESRVSQKIKSLKNFNFEPMLELNSCSHKTSRI